VLLRPTPPQSFPQGVDPRHHVVAVSLLPAVDDLQAGVDARRAIGFRQAEVSLDRARRVLSSRLFRVSQKNQFATV
jgi:hypothetical protein